MEYHLGNIMQTLGVRSRVELLLVLAGREGESGSAKGIYRGSLSAA